MARYAYVNGRYVDHREASVHVEDRGYQLADGVYEVVGVRDGEGEEGVGGQQEPGCRVSDQEQVREGGRRGAEQGDQGAGGASVQDGDRESVVIPVPFPASPV